MQNILRKRSGNRIGGALIVALAAQIIAEEEEEEEERRKHHRRCWVKPFLRQRGYKGKFENEFENLRKNPEEFFENFHMSASTFNNLFGLLEMDLTPRRSTRSDAISPKAKLAMILEYFVSANMQCDIGSSYRISRQHLGTTIDVVCDAICSGLSDELPKWDSHEMMKCASEFMNTWNFPNCVGAIGCTHVAVKERRFKGCEGSDSIILLAICNASYRFTYIDVESYKTKEVENIFSNSNFGKAVLSDSLDFPKDNVVNKKDMPYFVVGDHSFPLHKRIMKPYGTQYQTKEERVLNNRINQIRKCVDNTLGILTARWKVIQHTLGCHSERAQKIVKACCFLHNYLMRTSPKEYGSTDDFKVAESNVHCANNVFGHNQDYYLYVRNTIKDYVNSSAGSVPWQDDSDECNTY